mgnify:CR=1 FL=1
MEKGKRIVNEYTPKIKSICEALTSMNVPKGRGGSTMCEGGAWCVGLSNVRGCGDQRCREENQPKGESGVQAREPVST